MSRCIESGETSRKFNNNSQFDCVEFLESLLEHLWDEVSIPLSLNESVFGGLFQESFLCECGNEEKHPIKRLPDIISVPIQGETAQTCLDSYLFREQIEKKCSNCQSLRCWKSAEIIVPPSTIILHLKRCTYEEVTKITKKLRQKK